MSRLDDQMELDTLRTVNERLKSALNFANGVIECRDIDIERLKRERDDAELILDRTCKYIVEKLPLSGAHSVFENIDAAISERDQLRDDLAATDKCMRAAISSLSETIRKTNIVNDQLRAQLADALKDRQHFLEQFNAVAGQLAETRTK